MYFNAEMFNFWEVAVFDILKIAPKINSMC